MTDLLIRKTMASVLVLVAASAFGVDPHDLRVGKKEIAATREQRRALGLPHFMDGNLGIIESEDKIWLYGSNGSRPVRVEGTRDKLFQKVAGVSISTSNKKARYLSGGPVYRDPESGRIFLFYHAEIHNDKRGKKFYSTIGLSIQTDEAGLKFQDLGTIFTANIPNEDAKGAIEVCGAPYVIRDGFFYVYCRDTLSDRRRKQNNLSVVRASVSEVINLGLDGKNAEWKKYYLGAFSEPGDGGKSSALELGNPSTRWMDVTYNRLIKKYIMVVAANTQKRKVDLFLAFSEDCIHWGARRRITYENGEVFYPSIVSLGENSRETGREFYVYYTFSEKGNWDRWEDAVIARRRVTIAGDEPGKQGTGDGK